MIATAAPATTNTQEKTQDSDARRSLQQKMHRREASLTAVEKAFLHHLLIDDTQTPHDDDDDDDAGSNVAHAPAARIASRVLDDDMLFSVPAPLLLPKRPTVVKKRKDYRLQVGLWQAYEDGVAPKKLASMSTPSDNIFIDDGDQKGRDDNVNPKQSSTDAGMDDDDSADDGSTSSVQEVRPENALDDDSSDWDDDEGGFEHFDAWQVLKDDYAKDYGFDYKPDGTLPSADDTDSENNTFLILGTSADDQSAHPHVLSPPLMDALLTFVPDHLQGQNMWMKYSLIRDGACLETFKRYSRASKDSILAIETTTGEVFGAYTSSPWHTTFSFFGGAPSFVWRMRHGRNTPCHSLIEQAQMESEIDVFFLLNKEHRPQVCNSELLAVGEGDIRLLGEEEPLGVVDEIPNNDEEGNSSGTGSGFAIALRDDLLSGTSSQCSSYKNPCLVNPSSRGETFQVLNLELWTLTPCFSLESAEHLEMTQFFVTESLRNTSINSSRSSTASTGFHSRDLSQDEFYRRIGQHDEHEELRERWQYRNMMDGNTNVNRGLGASPRFNNTLPR